MDDDSDIENPPGIPEEGPMPHFVDFEKNE